MDSPQDLLLALQPWLRVLRDTTQNPLKPVQVQVVQLVTDGLTVDHRTFEALELLVLLSQIDYDAWKQAMRLTWPDYAAEAIKQSIDRALKVECSVEFLYPDQQIHVDDWLKRVIFSRSELGDSPGYVALRRRLEAAYAHRERDTQGFQPKPVPRDQLVIPVALTLSPSSYLDNLRKMLQVMTVQQATWIASAAKNEDLKPLFRVKMLMPGFIDGDLSVDAMLLMVQIVQLGGVIDQLNIFGVELCEPGLLATGLQTLMGRVSKDAEDAAGRTVGGGCDSVQICRLLDRRTSAAAYSALATSQTVDRVFLNYQGSTREAHSALSLEDHRDHWYWIAYAIFSRYAEHRISCVIFSADNLRLRDVAYVKEFLQHPHPLQLLCKEPAPANVSAIDEFVTASRFYFSDPTTQGKSGHSFARQQVRILASSKLTEDLSSKQFERVMLPGFGLAWVAREDIEERVSTGDPLPPALTEIVFHDVDHEGLRGIVELLRVVGHSFTTVRFLGIRDKEPLDEWLLSVLECCPRLQTFRMHGGVIRSLDTLAAAYERGLSRVEDVWLINTVVAESSQAPAFFSKLANPNHPMTRSLRRLKINYDSPSGSLIQVSNACRAVLAANYKLRMLSLLGYYERTDDAEEKRVTVSDYGKTAIHQRRLSLDLHAKLAFLSVVVGKDAEPKATQALDARVLSLVMQYAAQCETRDVYVLLWTR